MSSTEQAELKLSLFACHSPPPRPPLLPQSTPLSAREKDFQKNVVWEGGGDSNPCLSEGVMIYKKLRKSLLGDVNKNA